MVLKLCFHANSIVCQGSNYVFIQYIRTLVYFDGGLKNILVPVRKVRGLSVNKHDYSEHTSQYLTNTLFTECVHLSNIAQIGP